MDSTKTSCVIKLRVQVVDDQGNVIDKDNASEIVAHLLNEKTHEEVNYKNKVYHLQGVYDIPTR